MALTVLQIIQTVCRRVGILQPNSALSSNDQQIIQLVAISEEEGQEQADRYPWESLQSEVIFTTLATQVQGKLNTIAPGWNYITNDTIWNRTLRRPVSFAYPRHSDANGSSAGNTAVPFDGSD